MGESVSGEGMVYIATHAPTGRQYVGQTTKSFEVRLDGHLRERKSTYFAHVLRKHGIEQFDFQTVECFIEKLDDLEGELIATLGTRSPRGFNLTDGGGAPRGMVHSPETRKKISMAAVGKKHPHRGTPRTEEIKRHLSVVNTGRFVSEETKKKLSLANIGKSPSEETRRKLAVIQTGKKHSEETKRRLFELNIGKKMSAESKRKISQYWAKRRLAEGAVIP